MLSHAEILTKSCDECPVALVPSVGKVESYVETDKPEEAHSELLNTGPRTHCNNLRQQETARILTCPL